MENNTLTNNLEKEIFNKTFDLSSDYTEVAIDVIINDDILKEIPIVKSLISFYNISSSLIARHNVKKVIIFLQEFHSKKVDSDKLERFKTKLEKDSNKKNEILETVLVLIEKFIDFEKSKILANLFLAHIENKLTWKDFKKLSFILNNLNPSGYVFLEKCADKNTSMKMSELIEGEAFLLACGIGTKFEEQFKLTNAGLKLYEYGLKPLKYSTRI